MGGLPFRAFDPLLLPLLLLAPFAPNLLASHNHLKLVGLPPSPAPSSSSRILLAAAAARVDALGMETTWRVPPAAARKLPGPVRAKPAIFKGRCTSWLCRLTLSPPRRMAAARGDTSTPDAVTMSPGRAAPGARWEAPAGCAHECAQLLQQVRGDEGAEAALLFISDTSRGSKDQLLLTRSVADGASPLVALKLPPDAHAGGGGPHAAPQVLQAPAGPAPAAAPIPAWPPPFSTVAALDLTEGWGADEGDAGSSLLLLRGLWGESVPRLLRRSAPLPLPNRPPPLGLAAARGERGEGISWPDMKVRQR